MCGLCGKKSDEITEDFDYVFHGLGNHETMPANPENTVMLCNICIHTLHKEGDEENKASIKKYLFPYANFETYNYDMILEDIREDVNSCIESAKNSDDNKAAYSALKDAMQNVKSLKLEKDHREQLIESLREVLNEIDKKISEDRDKRESEYSEKYEKLKATVDEAVKNSHESNNFKESREKLIDAQNEFKNFNLKKGHREELFSALNKAFDDLNSRQSEERESYEMECIENYHNIKSTVENALNNIEKTDDLREARRILIDAQNHFKGLRLKKEQREEQYALIQESFDKINKLQDEEREQYEKECETNYSQLKPLVQDAVEFAAQVSFFKEGRERLINVQNVIKEKKLKRDQRDELFAIIRASFEELNKRQDEERAAFEKDTAENYEQIMPKVEDAIAFSKEATYFKEAREKLISLQKEIKELHLKRSQKDSLFQNIRTAFEALNIRQDAEREQYDKECADNYKILKENVDSAIAFANNSDDYGQARERLISSQSAIKGMKLKRDQRDELYAEIRTCFEDLNTRNEAERAEFEKESAENFELLINKVKSAVEDAAHIDDFRTIRENLIALQNEIKILKLRRKHRNELFDKIREAFSIFDERQESRREVMKHEKQEKLVLILSNLKEKKQRLEESLERDREALKTQEEKLDTLHPQINEIASENTKNNIKLLDERIKDKESNLEQISSRMNEIQEELKE